MAEKYGTVPKKFTKAWWEWYWMYYKWHTIGGLFILILAFMTAYDAITAEKFDITLTYAGKTYINETAGEKVEEALSPMCDDLDGNGKKSLYFSRLDVDMSSSDIEYLQARRLKIDMAFGEDQTYLFILDESMANTYQGDNAKECAFAPLEDWVTEDISDFETYTAHGTAYGIDISNLEIFKEAGIKTDGMYLFMRYYPRKDQMKEQLKGYEASINLANKMLAN